VSFLRELGREIRQAVDPAVLPESGVDELFDLYAVLLLAVGEDVTRADVHNAWCAWMVQRHPDHASVVPFEELPREVQAEDQPFVDAIREVFRRRHPRRAAAS
jgi:hypothetical protein